MNRPHLVNMLHKSLGEPDQLAFTVKEAGKPDRIETVEALPALENAIDALIPELSMELTRINGNFIRENTKPNSNTVPPTPLSFLLEGLENES